MLLIIYLGILGLCFGSFINALVYRLHKQSEEGSVVSSQESVKKKSKKLNTDNRLLTTQNRYSILHGRSMCVHCRHQLAVKDLLPVVSWLLLAGRCRYCSNPISLQYPAVELLTAALFVLSYLSWPGFQGPSPGITEALVFGLWLIALIGLIALAVYDIRWMLLPNRIIFPLYGLAIMYACALVFQQGTTGALFDVLLGSLIGGGMFYVLFQISNGQWIGGGDVKLGFFIGALAGSAIQSVLMLFLASLLGTLWILPLLAVGKITRKTRIPFGPFLITACVIVVLFGSSITSWYASLFL